MSDMREAVQLEVEDDGSVVGSIGGESKRYPTVAAAVDDQQEYLLTPAEAHQLDWKGLEEEGWWHRLAVEALRQLGASTKALEEVDGIVRGMQERE